MRRSRQVDATRFGLSSLVKTAWRRPWTSGRGRPVRGVAPLGVRSLYRSSVLSRVTAAAGHEVGYQGRAGAATRTKGVTWQSTPPRGRRTAPGRPSSRDGSPRSRGSASQRVTGGRAPNEASWPPGRWKATVRARPSGGTDARRGTARRGSVDPVRSPRWRVLTCGRVGRCRCRGQLAHVKRPVYG